MHRAAVVKRKAIPSGVLLLTAAWLGLACESPAPEPEPLPAEPAGLPIATLPLDQVSAPRAWADLEALSALMAAGANPDPGKAARDYVVEQLGRTGLDVELLETPEPAGSPDETTWTHVVATAPGASSELFVLVAPLGEASGTAAAAGAVVEDASGAALLLELARVISTRSMPYTTRFVWISGERRAAGTTDAGAAGASTDLRGSRALAAQMSSRAELSRIRLLVAFDRVCGENLRVARDLSSHRVHREEFFDAAVRTGRDRSFPRNQGFESIEASHLAFREAGVRTILAVVGSSGAAPDAAAPRCSAESFDAVATVTLDALEAIGRRLSKIDRFSRAPLAQP